MIAKHDADRPTARPVVDLGAWLDGGSDRLVFGVSCDGALYAAAPTTREPALQHRVPRSIDYVVLRWRAGEVQRLVIPGVPIIVSFIQPTPRGLLLVSCRCAWRASGIDRNAVEYDWEGRELERLILGDGIADVRTTPDGTIWVSYFDEGIFGNHGWNNPGPPGLGAMGWVGLEPDGRVRTQFSPERAGTGHICDLYATNVVGDDDAWLYYYTDFPIVHVRAGQYRAWQSRVTGASSLAVDGERVLLLGGYDKENDIAHVVELGPKGRTSIASRWRLTDESGGALDGALAFGVGSDLFLRRGSEILVVDVW